MVLNQLYSNKRTGASHVSASSDQRTEYQRDFDRIIFSSSFRRLQNKTQVFPLPGTVFVHNRLTHSLEVASVGRSLGTLIGDFICQKYENELTEDSLVFYKHSLYNVISSACLCHDIGNPAFGHSGEDAIASFFERNKNDLKGRFSEEEWSDFTHFEGNANAIRVLTQQQNGKDEGGLKLTYSTLASIAKYPCESTGRSKNVLHRKKFGFFQAEKNTFIDVATATKMLTAQQEPLCYFRHPFVWLVEAADDICYNIIDMEDAHRLGIVDHRSCEDILVNLIDNMGFDSMNTVKDKLSVLKDKNDRISYLRAKSISALTRMTEQIYQNNFESILQGNLKSPIYEMIKEDCTALKDIEYYSIENIYNHRSVVEIENAGYNVMYELLQHFIFPILIQKEDRRQSDKKALRLVPNQFLYDDKTPYERVLGIIDYVSGMTDNYATDLYKKIKGIEIGMTL